MIFYFMMIGLILSITNVYVIWFFIEVRFVVFIILGLSFRFKNFGLIIYYFFQSVISLFLFIFMMLVWDIGIFYILIAKLGIFPFFYWIVVACLKTDINANLFILVFQKISVFWLFWLLNSFRLVFLYIFSYLSLFFVVFSLIYVTDIWLLIVYSSIANSSLLIVRFVGLGAWSSLFLYLFIVLSIIFYLKIRVSYYELILVLYFFIVVPPFVLFYFKLRVVLSLIRMRKLVFFLFFFDVFVLFYYFSLVFIKFMIIEFSVLVYFINLYLVILILFLRNCVALIIFNKS